MEVNADQPNENKRKNLIGAYYSNEVGHYHLHLAGTQRQAEAWEHIGEHGRLQVWPGWTVVGLRKL